MTGALPSALPVSRVPDPAEAPPLRWGVIGTGWIAERFVAALHRLTRQRVVAVGSRGSERAEGFAARFGIERAHPSYASLVADPRVDVVYVATPHNAHRDHARLALEADRPVLVEKPLAINAAQAAELAALAAARGVLCVEALWTLFLPKFDVIRQLLADKVLGEVHTVLADHGESFPPEHRIFSPELAGGPLLDLGTYPVSFATWVLGSPAEVSAIGQPAPSGVNGQASALLDYPDRSQAVVHTTLFSNTPTTATVAGSSGTLHLPGPFYRPGGFTLTARGGASLGYREPARGYDGLAFEAAEVARCVADGRITSSIRPPEDSRATMAVIDQIRARIGAPFLDEL